MSDIQDVRSSWLKVARRLQAAATCSNSRGNSIMSIKIWVDKDGDPVVWTSPEVKLIEPCRADDILSLLG